MNIVNDSLQDENGNILFLSEEEYTKMVRGIGQLPYEIYDKVEIPVAKDDIDIFKRLVDAEEFESIMALNIKLIKEKKWEEYINEYNIAYSLETV